ncbi:MAG: C40 family peptidase [Bacteroidetes bacterium]|nr:C40 family peptidase [Bacteroidota bacterium]MBS1648803.1 C40 family peptidase [Bacteroidota bacterium]
MKKINFCIPTIIAVLAFASCKTTRTVTSKTKTATSKPTVKKTTNKPTFIDGIEVTPGTTVTSKHNTNNSKSKVEVKKTNPDPNAKNWNIEKANWLQLKYAIMLDATVERLTNIALLQKMEEWWGTKYCLGGNTKSCIDCSGFTAMMMQSVYNISLPRTAQQQYDQSEKIDVDELKEGDLVFFGSSGRRITHVGVYVTNNKFFNASTSSGVIINDLNEPYWRNRFIGGGRVIK